MPTVEPALFLLDDVVVYSASDLTAAAHCEFALMRRLDAKLGRSVEVAADDDPMLARAGRLGTAFELRTLDALRATREVIEFEQSFARFREQAAATCAALAQKRDVLYQATFFDGRLLGFADFIMLNAAGVYEVYDTKLARSAKVTALLQLAAYTDQLERLGVEHGSDVHLILGDGRTSTHRVADILPVYRRRRARLQQLIDERQESSGVTECGDPRYTACGRCEVCAPEVALHRDLLLVAGMRSTQRARLIEAGIPTIDALAVATGPVNGVSAAALHALRAQARVQVAPSTGVPAVEVYRANALGAIPEPDAGDIFFDFEGDPLYSESADGSTDWGLDYLFGLVDAVGAFRAFWAHSYAQERQALIDFLAFVAERRARHPGMHIYHYAAYERTHLLSLAARHGVGENAVDDLLRDNVLVDLYPIVRKALRVGSQSYSIKKLEPLYMTVGRAADGVTNGADSVTAYADARQLIDDGHAIEGQAGLDAIATYNEYDCLSTLRLRDWLRELAATHGSAPVVVRDPTLDIPVPTEPSAVYTALAAQVADVPRDDRSSDETAIALASAAIDYHRREAKQFWQDHFDRLVRPVDEWADVRGVLVVHTASIETDWVLEGRQRKARRVLRLEGTLAPGSSLGPGAQPYLVYGEDAAPPIAARRSPGAKASSAGEILEVIDGTPTIYRIQELLEVDAPRHDWLPVALTPPAPPRAKPQPEAIEEWGQQVLGALPAMLPDAALDVLRRVPPRGQVFGGDPIEAIERSLLTLDHSYLAVQGPPGTGKTYTGSRVIASLVARGWKIGVVAQSHTTVENMLRAVAAAGVPRERIGKKPKTAPDSDAPFTPLTTQNLPQFTDQAGGWVVGGTAWTFANAGAIPRRSLDLLVIDEAGQFSLASTIASAVSARRLLLLGDPQQLPQVSQGSHPEPIDVSALGWLSAGHDVLPPEFGYFLAKSWRMHPAVCAPVSRLSYEGKLESRAEERMLVGVAPGLHPEPISHQGNATSSLEEARRVVELVRSLHGRSWNEGDTPRPLGLDDIIVVAPYNAQVELIALQLDAAGFGAVPVGTVDRFQGREAAIAIVSLAASSAAEVPRGLEFVLLANRLNVAISRAQWAAYLLYSPELLESLPSSAAGLAQLSAFIELVGAD
ncbi:TM0106 family RecB-like putative nuclease [soil metagenome]